MPIPIKNEKLDLAILRCDTHDKIRDIHYLGGLINECVRTALRSLLPFRSFKAPLFLTASGNDDCAAFQASTSGASKISKATATSSAQAGRVIKGAFPNASPWQT
jgi:hypothetical protein